VIVDPSADDRLDRAFMALADPVRRRIIARLSRGPATVNELAEPFQITKQAVSKHIQVLEQAELVTRSRDAQRRPVHLNATRLEALTAYGDSHFEVVLMDIQMPLMDGLSASRAIRAIETEQGRARLPIIALTAHALPADRVRCAEAGMDGFLSKPFKSADLISLIEELIQSNTQNCPACVP